MKALCNNCDGEGWVCEAHPNKAWRDGDGCCGGAGMPCKCNTSNPPWHHEQDKKKNQWAVARKRK